MRTGVVTRGVVTWPPQERADAKGRQELIDKALADAFPTTRPSKDYSHLPQKRLATERSVPGRGGVSLGRSTLRS